MVWYNIKDQEVCLKLMEKDQLCSIALMNRKWIFEGFTQNGCYGNKPQPFEVVFYTIDPNTSCSFTKQDLTVKPAYLVSFCFSVIWTYVLAVNSCFQCSLQAFSEIPSFYNTPIWQIIPCHVTDVKMLRLFLSNHHNPISAWLAQVSGVLHLNTL